MTESQAKSADRIQGLLDERLKVMQWMDKLNAAPDDIPSDVRDRVKADYQTRLDSVAKELQSYTSEIQSNLLKQQHARDALAEKEKAADTRLAEAKLRHAVGEFGEDQWSRMSGEITGELNTVRQQIQQVDGEISKLEEVLSMIREKPPSTQIRQAIPMVEPPPPPPPPPPSSKPGVEVSTGQSDALDDLAFISPTGSQTASPKDSLGVTHGPPPPESPAGSPAPSPSPAPTQTGAAEQSGPGGGPKKTLKCGECGVMNFPTEWYCERCGAELAAL